MKIIVAVDENFGIGKNGKLPWNVPLELELFKKKTLNYPIVFGRKTYENLPKLKDRKIFVLTNNKDFETKHPEDTVVSNLYHIDADPDETWVGGGREVYKQALQDGLVDEIHMSIIKGEYDCDTFFDKAFLDKFGILHESHYEEFTHYIFKKITKETSPEFQYLNLINDIRLHGNEREGRNGKVKSMFGKNMKFDLREGFPLLTTKKMFWRGIVEELLMFLRGDTNTKEHLEEKGINIWKGNTSKEFIKNRKLYLKEGEMGPMYGWNWRRFNQPFNFKDEDGIPFKSTAYPDQLAKIIDEIKSDSNSRRMIMTTFNPATVDNGVLYPCHSIVSQFYVEDGHLDMFCYNRSSDVFLGLPFNIASSSLMLMIIANLTDLKPRYFHLSLGDCHIYEEHYEAVKKQLDRLPYVMPTVDIVENDEILNVEDIPKFTLKSFELKNYTSHKIIKAEMKA